jgi:hypothetical protein
MGCYTAEDHQKLGYAATRLWELMNCRRPRGGLLRGLRWRDPYHRRQR